MKTQYEPVAEQLRLLLSRRRTILPLRLDARPLRLLPLQEVGIDARKELLLLRLTLALTPQSNQFGERRSWERMDRLVHLVGIVDEARDRDEGVGVIRLRSGDE